MADGSLLADATDDIRRGANASHRTSVHSDQLLLEMIVNYKIAISASARASKQKTKKF